MNDLRVVLYQNGGVWIAQCLERDLCTQGMSEDEVCERFKRVLRFEVLYDTRKGGVPLERLKPAPTKFFNLFRGARPVEREPRVVAGLAVQFFKHTSMTN